MSGMMCIQALIVDDEPLARERIRDMLETDSEVEIVGECASGQEAIEAIRQNLPDLIFLDVEMPGKAGLAMLEELEPGRIPAVIFVTAYDQYAVRAFEVYALDYLLKPFDQERFEKALSRAKAHVQNEKSENITERILSALEEIKARPVHLERLVIKMNGHVFFLKTEEIDWLEAEGNFLRAPAGKEFYLFGVTIK